MKRVLVDAIPEPGATCEPGPEESHHLVRVRRARVGEMLEMIDGRGGLALGRIDGIAGKTARIAVLERLDERRESPLHLALGLAVPVQLATFDAMLPALVQLGVDHIVLTPTAYSGRLKKNRDRYLTRLRQIAVQALKQSGRLVLPHIELAADWDGCCRALTETCEQVLLFHPGHPPAWPEARPGSLGLLFGPEGGFSDDEVATAKAAGCHLVGLGPRILKMETAVVGAAFQAQHGHGDLGSQSG